MPQTAAMSALAGKMSHASFEDRKMPIIQARRLPVELLVAIADQLRSHQDIVAFGLTCKDLYTMLVNKQRRSLKIRFTESTWPRVQDEAPVYRLLNQQAAMLTFSGHESSRCPDDSDPQNGLRSCSGWGLANSLVAADRLFSQDDYKFANSIKELTLTGYFPLSEYHNSLNSHPFIGSSGFKAIRPEAFIVDLGLTGWDFRVLEGMSVNRLKSLRLPISLSSDCVGLGQALTNMPELVSLAITDIPDRENFTSGLKAIGKGIMSCASTLRELDIEMTNFNHAPAWCEDERFVEPKEQGFFFRKLFPCSSTEEPSALCRHRFQVDTGLMAEAPFRLTKLRLKHMSLPWYAFGEVFNARTIRDIHLPYSMVDGEVWRFLKTYAKLDTLTGISYDMLSAEFLEFLSQQSSLKALTFVRPQDQYEVSDITFYGDSPSVTYEVSKYAPRLGPDSGAGYPKLYESYSSLEDLKSLKHLVLPVDMYTITSSSLVSLATSLTSLEHVELGFDYKDCRLQQTFASNFLCGMPTLRKITLFTADQRPYLYNSDSVLFHNFVKSLGGTVSANLKFLRYVPLDRIDDPLRSRTQIFYHCETPLYGKWWIPLPDEVCEKVFAEGRTPRLVPVGKWDWETNAARKGRGKGGHLGPHGKARLWTAMNSWD